MNRIELLRSLWISIDKRLPPEDNNYIWVWCRNCREAFTITGGMVYDRLKIIEKDRLAGKEPYWNYTHWMPVISPFIDEPPNPSR